MKIKNLAAFSAAMDRAVQEAILTKVVPAVKGAILDMAGAVIEGEAGYVGTPEWKGNAVANWYLTFDSPATSYQQFFDDPPAPGDPGFEGESPYSANSPRANAVQISLARVRAAMATAPALPRAMYLTNTAPYLNRYQPYAGDGAPLFRLANLFPMSTTRAAVRTTAKIRAANGAQFDAWRARMK